MSTPETTPDEEAPVAGRGWFGRMDRRRSLIMLAAGALLGLAIAGFGLFTSKGTSTSRVPAEDVALVNNRPILMTDFIAQLESDFGVTFAEATAAQKKKVLHDMINEELTVQRAVEVDLPGTNGDVRASLVNAMQLQVAANVLAERPTEEVLRKYYDAHRERYRTNGTLTLAEVVAPDPAKAAACAAALRGGASAEAAAVRCGGKATGRLASETFDITAKLALGPQVYAAVETLTPGQVSAPVAAADGVHVARVIQRIPPVLPPFDDVVKTLFADYQRDAREPVEQANDRYMRGKATILYAPGYRD